MLLPQSAAFKTLHARLHSVPTLALLQLEQPCVATASRKGERPADAQRRVSLQQHVDFSALLAVFRQRQVCAPFTFWGRSEGA